MKEQSLIYKINYQITEYEEHKLYKFTKGKTQWWYSPHYDRIMAMTTGERPLPFMKKHPEIDDWIFVLETVAGKAMIK